MTDRRDGTERRAGWREMMATRRFVTIAFVLAVVYMTALWWKAEYDSCMRASTNREPIRKAIQSFPEVRGTLGREPKLLDCGPPFPDH